MSDKYIDQAMQLMDEWAKGSDSIASHKIVYENISDDGRQLRKLIAAALRDNAADLSAARAENVRLREALSALLDEYRVRMFAIGHTYDDIDSQVVVTESRAALAAAAPAGA